MRSTRSSHIQRRKFILQIKMMRSNGTNLNFSRDEALNQVVITVKSTETGKVIRQIPDETFLKIAHNIESLKGLLHNEEI